MAKSNAQPDVLVLGQHPCAYLAAWLMLEKPGVTVAHATIPGDAVPDRLLIINPQLFGLHKPLEKIRKKLELAPVYGVVFLASDDAQMRGEFHSKTPIAHIGCYSNVRKHLAALAKEAGARCIAPKSLRVEHVHEKGFEVDVDAQSLRPKAVLLAGNVPADQAKTLGLPDDFSHDVMRRYSFLRLKGIEKWTTPQEKPVLPMSLDLSGKLTWAWMLIGVDEVQLAVEQPIEEAQRTPPASLLEKWIGVLKRHGFMKSSAPTVKLEQVESHDVPAAGALSREIVANRTLLFGPAGGFYSASMEDLYPNCWSAVFAVEAVREALGQQHLQDSLQPYRQNWGTTLGEYLRGPQQNLRFLLPLVYRNPTMTRLMAESILLGKPVVR